MMLKYILISVLIVAAVESVQITRPCNRDDHKCIRDNVAANSRCNPYVRGSLPDSYTLPQFKFDTPYFNATYIDDDLVIKNHNGCKFSEFFFNIATDSSLLTLDCPNLIIESSRTLIQHYTKRQDTIFRYLITSTYPLIQLTVDLKHADSIDLCSSYTFAYVAAIPTLNITPIDIPTAKALARDLSYMNVFSREEIHTRANQLFRTYFNNYVCDFGCNA